MPNDFPIFSDMHTAKCDDMLTFTARGALISEKLIALRRVNDNKPGRHAASLLVAGCPRPRAPSRSATSCPAPAPLDETHRQHSARDIQPQTEPPARLDPRRRHNKRVVACSE